MRVHHIAIQVPDLDAARAFYAGVLGFTVTREQPHSLWLDAGGVIVMLERCTDPTICTDAWQSDRPGHFVVAFQIAATERDSMRKRLSDAGVKVSHESAFSLYFRDPWGARLAFSHYPDALTLRDS